MEEKKNVKISLTGLLLIFAIIVIVILSFLLYKVYSDKQVSNEKVGKLDSELSNLNEKVDGVLEENKEIKNLTEKKDTETPSDKINSDIEENDELINEESVFTDEKNNNVWAGDISEVDLSKISKANMKYENIVELSNNYESVNLKMNIYYGRVGVSLTKDIEKVLGNIKLEEFGYINFTGENEFSNFVNVDALSDVKSVVFGTIGQDFNNESPVIFLMNDGTIKYDSIINVIKNKVSAKTLNLKNIVKLYSANINYFDGPGAITTIAVDKNGTAYDLSDYIKY